jgi:hypothetical protein
MPLGLSVDIGMDTSPQHATAMQLPRGDLKASGVGVIPRLPAWFPGLIGYDSEFRLRTVRDRGFGGPRGRLVGAAAAVITARGLAGLEAGLASPRVQGATSTELAALQAEATIATRANCTQ